jgi:NAD(P)-dependent dehydrogenase (short-subunit alcohol dehydrogenase family)
MPLAVITGASRGLGQALATTLASEGWDLVLDGRDAAALRAAAPPGATLVPGDVTDASHREAVREAVAARGGADLLVLNASTLGPTPLPRLRDLPVDALRQVLETNAVAPLALVQLLLPHVRGAVVGITSDAATEAYEGWGGYGAAKATLEQLLAVLAVEEPQLRVLRLDPGEMQTRMLRDALPDDDLSDRRLPAEVAPVVLRLLDLPSGRYAADDLLSGAAR